MFISRQPSIAPLLNACDRRTHAPTRTAPPSLLSQTDFRFAVDAVPLVSVDLLVRNSAGAYLLGLRTNPPAQGFWFVPGGRIQKNERVHDALARLSREELARLVPAARWRFLGHYEHFYDVDFTGDPGRSTHYVALVYETEISGAPLELPTAQHMHYRWLSPRTIAREDNVHSYTRAYFTEHLK